jgi:hypothetical protein
MFEVLILGQISVDFGEVLVFESLWWGIGNNFWSAWFKIITRNIFVISKLISRILYSLTMVSGLQNTKIT